MKETRTNSHDANTMACIQRRACALNYCTACACTHASFRSQLHSQASTSCTVDAAGQKKMQRLVAHARTNSPTQARRVSAWAP